MTPIRFLAPVLIAAAFASCASQQADPYDTANPYGAADAGQAYQEPNPVYDTPAAYEESGSTASSSPSYDYTPPSSPAAPQVPSAPASPHAPATIHTVVRGDTLSGISAKYKVPIASIKQANQMTNDVVVLGRKMVIPAR